METFTCGFAPYVATYVPHSKSGLTLLNSIAVRFNSLFISIITYRQVITLPSIADSSTIIVDAYNYTLKRNKHNASLLNAKTCLDLAMGIKKANPNIVWSFTSQHWHLLWPKANTGSSKCFILCFIQKITCNITVKTSAWCKSHDCWREGARNLICSNLTL